MERDFQGRPPLPEEEDASRVRLSHAPMAVGEEMTTLGATGFAGAKMDTDTVVEAFFQRDCSGHDALLTEEEETLSGQAAFTAACGASDRESKGTAQLPPPVALTARMDLLSTQRQRDEDAQGKANISRHGKDICMFPRLVLVSNVMVIEAPSSENSAVRRRGTGGSSPLPTTKKLSSEEE